MKIFIDLKRGGALKTWTVEDVEVLKENYNKMTNTDLCMLFPHKTMLAIYKKAYSIGLRKDKEIEFKNRSIAKSGEKSGAWKGGVLKTTKGYVLVKMPNHHRSDSKGYVLEHILVFEKETGLKVPEGCCVHHINGKKDDNRIENLCLMTHSAHTVFHHTGSKRSDETKQNISKGKKGTKQ